MMDLGASVATDSHSHSTHADLNRCNGECMCCMLRHTDRNTGIIYGQGGRRKGGGDGSVR